MVNLHIVIENKQLMKTKDSISKRRQKLATEAHFWENRGREASASIALVPEDFIKRKEAVLFCQQEAAKRWESLKKLNNRTFAQRRAGWK